MKPNFFSIFIACWISVSHSANGDHNYETLRRNPQYGGQGQGYVYGTTVTRPSERTRPNDRSNSRSNIYRQLRKIQAPSIDKVTGKFRAGDLGRIFKEYKDVTHYHYGRLRFDIDEAAFNRIDTGYPSQDLRLIHVNILVARWFASEGKIKQFKYVENKAYDNELIHPVYINTPANEDVIVFDVDKEDLDLPIRLNEPIDVYARRIRHYFDKFPANSVSSIIDKEFFDICDGRMGVFQHNRNMTPYTRCGVKLLNDIRTRIHFTASSLDLIQFE